MKVMVIVKATESSEAGVMPSAELMAEMGKFNEELIAAGIMKTGDGLKPSSAGARVHFSGTSRTVTDGPFAETKELVAGYWIWEVKSLDEAKEWVKRCPNPMPEDSVIEIRPHYEMADFAEWDESGEFVKKEAEQRVALAGQGAMVRTYLFFGGRCEEALEFYKSRLVAKVGCMMRFDQSPEPMPEGMLEPGFESKVMHAEFKIGDVSMYASDGCRSGEVVGGFSLTLTVGATEDAEQLFAALADGGRVDMPLSETFWSPLYGQVTDRFGISWMVMVAGPESQG